MSENPVWKNEKPTVPGEYWYSCSDPTRGSDFMRGGTVVSVYPGLLVDVGDGKKAWCRDMSDYNTGPLFQDHRDAPASNKRLCVTLPLEQGQPVDEVFYDWMWFAGPLPEPVVAT